MWDAPTITATVIGCLSLVISSVLLGLRWQDGRASRKSRDLRARLAAQMKEGGGLSREVNAAPPDGDFSDIEERINAWCDRTIAVLDEAGPEFGPLFLSDAGYTFYGSPETAKRDHLRNFLIGRSRRLGEILGRI